MRPALHNAKSAPIDERRKIPARSISQRTSIPVSPREQRSRERGSRRSPVISRSPRSRSPSLSPRPHMRRKSSHWDFDLNALENTLEQIDQEHDEFEKTAEIFMAARWSHIRKIQNVVGREEWIYRSDWVSFWGSSALDCEPIGPSIAGKLFDVLMDKRKQGRVSMREIEFFAKSSQRLWRQLAAKGERSLQKFSWWEEQVQLRRNSSIERDLIILTSADSEEDQADDLEPPDVFARRTQSEHLLPEGRLERMIRELTKARTQYEQEINRLTDKNAMLTRQNAELTDKCDILETELRQIKTGSFCNIPGHEDKATRMLPRTASLGRTRTKPDLFEDFKLDTEADPTLGVQLQEDEQLEIKKAVGQVQVEAVWTEATSLDVDVDLAASLFDSQKRFVRHVMWGPRADRSYRRGVIILHEDVRSGGDEGEKMDIFLDKMPPDIQYIVITTTIFSGSSSFVDLATCDVKVRGAEVAEEEQNICRFQLSGTSGRDCNAVIMAMFKRKFDEDSTNEWTFHAVGRNAVGTKVAEIQPAIQRLIDEQ